MYAAPNSNKYRYAQPKSPDDLVRLGQHAVDLSKFAASPNTIRTYSFAWKLFEDWCLQWRDCPPLPARPETVQEFIAWCSQMREPSYKSSTIHLILTAVNRKHRDYEFPVPVDAKARQILAGVHRGEVRQGSRPEQLGKKNLTVDMLKRMCAAMGTEEPIDIRDRAILLLGFTSALRRSNLTRIEADHLHFEPKCLRIWIPWSKTDQLGHGRSVHIPPALNADICPIRAIRAWNEIRVRTFGKFEGPLFIRCLNRKLTLHPLGNASISLVLQRRLTAIGEDATEYGAHSMRSGMITAADEAGASLRSIMDHTQHHCVSTVMRYIKSNRSRHALDGVL